MKHIENTLAVVRGLYVKRDEKIDNQVFVDYAANCLTGVNTNALLRQAGNHHKYLGHLKRYKGNSAAYSAEGKFEKTELEGWRSEKFISLRIRSFLKIILEIDSGHLLIDLKPRDRKVVLDAIYQEISVLVNTLHICHALNAICSMPSDKRAAAQLVLAQNMSKQLEDDKGLPEEHEFSFAGGWYKHAVYINFVKSKDNRLFVRIDNLGSGCNIVSQLTKTHIKLGEERWSEDGKQKIDEIRPFFNRHDHYRGKPSEWLRLHPLPAGYSSHYQRRACVLGAFDFDAKRIADVEVEKEKLVQYLEGIIAERVKGDTTPKPIINDPKLTKKERDKLIEEAEEKLSVRYKNHRVIPTLRGGEPCGEVNSRLIILIISALGTRNPHNMRLSEFNP